MSRPPDYSKIDYSKYQPKPASFTGSSHISAPPQIELRGQILEARYLMFKMWEEYEIDFSRNQSASIEPFRSKVRTLFMLVQAAIKRDYTSDKSQFKKKDYLNLVWRVEHGARHDLISAIYEINEYLDMKFLTRFDTRMNYDHSKAYLENEYLSEY